MVPSDMSRVTYKINEHWHNWVYNCIEKCPPEGKLKDIVISRTNDPNMTVVICQQQVKNPCHTTEEWIKRNWGVQSKYGLEALERLSKGEKLI